MRPARLLDRHIHPICFVSLGLLGFAVVFDVAYLLLNDPRLALVSYWNLSAGLIGGLHAALSGFWDWLAIPRRTRAKAIGLWHGSIIVVVMTLFASSWWIRGADFNYLPDASGLALSFLAFGLMLILGWFDGQLIELLGVGGEREAGVNAPVSLRAPAQEAIGGPGGANPPMDTMRPAAVRSKS